MSRREICPKIEAAGCSENGSSTTDPLTFSTRRDAISNAAFSNRSECHTWLGQKYLWYTRTVQYVHKYRTIQYHKIAQLSYLLTLGGFTCLINNMLMEELRNRLEKDSRSREISKCCIKLELRPRALGILLLLLRHCPDSNYMTSGCRCEEHQLLGDSSFQTTFYQPTLVSCMSLNELQWRRIALFHHSIKI